jgi:hypothetical protein
VSGVDQSSKGLSVPITDFFTTAVVPRDRRRRRPSATPPSFPCQSLNGLHRRQRSDTIRPVYAVIESSVLARPDSPRVVYCLVIINGIYGSWIEAE